MKTFDDFKINEEWSNQDNENLIQTIRLIQRRVPSFRTNFNNFHGTVSANGAIIFETNGNETPLVVSTFVNGYLMGLAKGINLNK